MVLKMVDDGEGWNRKWKWRRKVESRQEQGSVYEEREHKCHNATKIERNIESEKYSMEQPEKEQQLEKKATTRTGQMKREREKKKSMMIERGDAIRQDVVEVTEIRK